MGSRFGWRAEIVSEPLRDAKRLLIFRYSNLNTSEIMCLPEPTFVTLDQGGLLPPNPGLVLPMDIWSAIVECADPAPHGAEIRRLEEALFVERSRVDALLARAMVTR